jgi:hypothetical protein
MEQLKAKTTSQNSCESSENVEQKVEAKMDTKRTRNMQTIEKL